MAMEASEEDYYFDEKNWDCVLGSGIYKSKDFLGHHICSLIKMKNGEYLLKGRWVNYQGLPSDYDEIVKIYRDDLSLIRDIRSHSRINYAGKHILDQIGYIAAKNIINLKKENEKLKKQTMYMFGNFGKNKNI